MTPDDELTRDRERRLVNQKAFPRSFVSCSCEQGCLVCAHTGLVSRAEAKQLGHREPAPGRIAGPQTAAQDTREGKRHSRLPACASALKGGTRPDARVG